MSFKSVPFLFAFHGNYGSVLRPKARYWSKIVHSTLPLGGPRRNIVIQFGVDKIEWWGYPMVKKF